MKNLHHHIFSETTCISKETMLKFINKQLSQKELHDVQKHLIDCDFCSEALEGLKYAKNSSVLFNIDHKIASRTQQNTTPFSKIILVAASLLLIVTAGYYTVTNFNNAAIKESELAYEQPIDEEVEQAVEEVEMETLVNQAPAISSVSSTNQQGISAEKSEAPMQQKVSSEQVQSFSNNKEMASGNAITQTFSTKERIASDIAEAEESVADNILFEETTVATKKDAEKEMDMDANMPVTLAADKKSEKPSKNKTRAKTTQAPSPATYGKEDAKLEKKEVQPVVTDEENNNRTENTTFSNTTTGGLTSASSASEENHLEEGKASYNLKDYVTAIHHFDLVLAETKTTNRTYEAKWYKALCFIGLNDKTTAKKLLLELTYVNNPFSKKAEAKLKEF